MRERFNAGQSNEEARGIAWERERGFEFPTCDRLPATFRMELLKFVRDDILENMETKPCAECLGIRIHVWLFLAGFAASTISLRHIADRQPSMPSSDHVHEIESPARFSGTAPRPRWVVVSHPADETEVIDQVVDLQIPSFDTGRLHEFVNTLSSPLAEDRRNAALALSRLSFAASDAVPQLTDLAFHDPDEKVRERAREALFNIRGFDGSFRFGVAKN